ASVELDEVPIYQEEDGYYLLYKPKGVISSVADDKGSKVVTDLLPMVKERIFPVGRLDYDTSCILLLTNDGDFDQRLTHTKHEVDKVYFSNVKGISTKSML
ncbi:pseudouridine synthase, partial [Enterococcus faecium]